MSFSPFFRTHRFTRLVVALLWAALFAWTALAAPRTWAATITVNSAGDAVANDGACTLREAIIAANNDTASGAAAGECAAGSGGDIIEFNIAGSGVKVIAPTVALPGISTPIFINGYSQPGSSANTNAIGSGLGSNAVIRIEIDNGAVANAATLEFNGANASGSIVQGIAFSRSANSGCCLNIGIRIEGVNGVWIRGNFFGTNAGGSVAKKLADRGIYINNANNIIVGSDTIVLQAAHQNVFSATSSAITTTGVSPAFKGVVTVRGNLIGTDASGIAVVTGGSVDTGLALNNLTGASQVSDNVIAGTLNVAIDVRSTDGLLIEKNSIGVGANGTTALGNGRGIIVHDNPFVGGSGVTGVTIGRNTIANNLGAGVTVQRDNAANVVRGVVISKNVMRNNVGMEIDLFNGSVSDGITDNDALDADTGANNLQNSPNITGAISNGTSIQTTYNFTSEPNKSFTLEFFHVAACDGSKLGGSDVFLASLGVTTNAAGQDIGSVPLNTALFTGAITATATNVVNGTSEYSDCTAIVPPNFRNLVISKQGSGTGTVTGTGIACGADCFEAYLQGATVTLTATPDVGSAFFPGWSGGGCSGTGSCTVTMSQDYTVSAQFTAIAAVADTLLTTTVSGSGSGTVTATGINCGADCSELYVKGASVTLTATPSPGSVFFPGWSGGGCSGTGTCTVTMSAAQTVNAQFSLAVPAQSPQATPVPTLNSAMLAALSLLTAIAAWALRRRVA